MSFFSRSPSPVSTVAAPPVKPLSEAEAMQLAGAARKDDDWATALIALERVPKKKDASAAYHELRDWALAKAGRKGARHDWSRLKLGGDLFGLTPDDAMALTYVVREVRPLTILEVGSRGGGVAKWLHAMCAGLGLQTQVHSADWGIGGKDANVQFWSGDLRKPADIWPDALLKKMANPCLVLIRTMGGHEVTWSALRSLHKWLGKDAVVCVENEPGADPAEQPEAKKTSVHALLRFLALHPVAYRPLAEFDQHFGPHGLPTNLTCFQRTGLELLAASAAPALTRARGLIEKGEWQAALDDLNPRKAARKPERGLDYLRSICFLEQGAVFGACEAAKEELRYFPDHSEAAAMLASLLRQLFPGKPKLGGPEFHELYRLVRTYTMLSDERLYSLYLRTRLVCQMDVPGDLVECGVAAGGGSAMIAATMARHTKRPRKLYSCDTFDGMPVPTDKDVAYGVSAEASGWGSGTCAAPPGSLLEVCEKLGVGAHVVPVKGFFKDTLPGLKDRLSDGIAFLHMDGDWYKSTMDILVSLYEKVQSRGFIQVSGFAHWEGCHQAMRDYAKPKGFEFNVHIIDGTGVWLQRPDRQASDLMLLNLGCGGHYHRDWVNIDIAPATKEVIYHDLANEPLPFEDGSCAAVYHSHVLEHIPPAAVPAFIRECHRVLAPGGVIRIAVPDLEGLAREYLRQLESGDAEKHEWMIIEMIDQLARNYSGGRMMEYWKQDPMPAEEFVFQRSGREAQQFVEHWRANPVASAPPSHDPTDIGRFRLSGEVHQWMYDRVSLSRLLLNEGFTNPRVCGAQESGIKDFARYELDANAAGQVRKPDSLFIEATRPL